MSDPIQSQFARYQLAELAAPGSDTFVDGPFGSTLKSHEYVESGVRLIQLQNIGEGEWRDQNKKYITSRKFKVLERHGAVPGDIAIAKMADPVARACIVPAVSEQFVVVADCIRLRLDESRFDAGYVVRAINSPYTRREAEKKAIGSTRVRINLSVLKTVGCLAPPLPAQREISRILETLDTAIHQTEAIIAKLKAVKQGLLHDLLTRGIAANGELRPPQAEAPHLYNESPLGWIPKEWEEVTLGEIARRSGGLLQTGPFGSQLHAHEYVLDGIPVIMPQDMVNGELSVESIARINQRKATALSRHRVQPNDLVFSRRGDLSRCVAIEEEHLGWLCGTGCLLARLPVHEVNGYWLALVYTQPGVQTQVMGRAVGSTMANLNTSILAAISIARPPIKEQNEIARRLKSLNKRIRFEEQEFEKRQSEKAGLMDDLLTGRIRVTPLLAEAAQQPGSA